jgi:hypothetical protein
MYVTYIDILINHTPNIYIHHIPIWKINRSSPHLFSSPETNNTFRCGLDEFNMAPNTTDTLSFYEDEKNLKKLCDFLRSSDGPAVREAIEMDKRVYYLKGTNAKC